MKWFDVLIVVVPVLFVLGMGLYSRRYLKDATSFLSAGRVCGRYVISMGDIANALSIIALLAYVEVHYKTGFALGFWGSLMTPLTVILALYGYCTYRYRETKSQSIGQFIEMRYSRRLRSFSAALRSLSEMLANMIMPALAARFFMYFLGLPDTFEICGVQISTFSVIMIVVLTVAISIICMGGCLSIIVTDTIQGFICYPLLAIFVVFILVKFSWNSEVLPILSDRVAGESFLNPYDVENLRDFNYLMLIYWCYRSLMGRMDWFGGGGSSSASKSPHEQKMASLLGTWRQAILTVFYLVMAVAILTFMNHLDFAPQAHEIRTELTGNITRSLVKDPQIARNVIDNFRKMPVQAHQTGIDRPLSEKANVDTRYLNNIHQSLKLKNETQGNTLFQQFRTLYYQQMLPATLRKMLPPGILGLFCLLMILAMISTDDSRIFSATLTISQDVILPHIKKELTPKQHLWMLRIVAVCIGVFFFIGSSYMAQLDYINMYVTLVTAMWTGGCGPMLIFGLYSRFGTTIGAWASLLSGMFLAVSGILVQRNWANAVYPWLADHGWVDPVGNALAAMSRPFEPIIVWRMDAVKCPVNSIELTFITSLLTLAIYVVVSLMTCRRPFNLDRMLHRGKYAIDRERNVRSAWSWKTMFGKIIGITPEYTFWDRVIAWGYFYYTIVYRFIGAFVLVVVWNIFDPWPISWWGWYFLITFLIIPGFMAAFTAVWFGICGTIDLKRMFHDLNARIVNPLDNGRVEGNVSLADKAAMDKIDRQSAEK